MSVTWPHTFIVLLLLLANGQAANAEDSPSSQVLAKTESSQPQPESPTADVIVVLGAEGTAEIGKEFQAAVDAWSKAANAGHARLSIIGSDQLDPNQSDRERLKQALSMGGEESERLIPLWLVLIGHGTWDGKNARFNLRGNDVSATELATWLNTVNRPIAVVNCASASGPFLNALSGNNRVIVTATKSGSEYNLTRLARPLAEALLNLEADLDKDEQVSLLEAWLWGASKVREFYAGDGRLETEHPLIDDNGDKLGTPTDWFEGVIPVKTARTGAAADGSRANQWVLVHNSRDRKLTPEQRFRRDNLELELARIRGKKDQVSEAEYLDLLEPVLLELARMQATGD